MKWKNKKAQYGDVRQRRVYAWFPAQVGDEKVWLEYYTVHEIYEVGVLFLVVFKCWIVFHKSLNNT